MPGPRPRSRSLGIEHYELLWLYAAGADQVTNHLHACIRSLHLQSLCVENGRRERLVWTPSSQDLGLHPWHFFVRLVMTRLSVSAPITRYFLQSQLSREDAQVGVGLSGSTSWYI